TGDYNGDDSFTYVAVDSLDGSSAVTTVDITVNSVNDAPVATGDGYMVDEDNTLNGSTVLINDTDVDGDDLTAMLVDDVAHGVLTLNSDGTFTYTPAENYHGPDAFTYKANDGAEDSGTVTVDITVNSINDAPVATGESYVTAINQPLSVAEDAGVLVNDADVADGDALAADLVTGPAHGMLTLNADGSFDYTPEAGFAGSDSFTYVASDGTDDSAETTVLITVLGVLDVDDNGLVQPLTDGILIIRYLAGFTGETLIAGAIGAGASRTDPNDIIAILDASVGGFLDADGNGATAPLTDGILIIRYMAGFTGGTLASGAVGSGAVRTTGEEIGAYLDGFQPINDPPPVVPQPAEQVDVAPPAQPADEPDAAAVADRVPSPSLPSPEPPVDLLAVLSVDNSGLSRVRSRIGLEDLLTAVSTFRDLRAAANAAIDDIIVRIV
ncbi:MAG: tandem-95 repeat protein, partial [Phycisphaera sp.]|nr:tandem-95 repeat protein [Phycisphaera sp.]